jgi:hypothetical protein
MAVACLAAVGCGRAAEPVPEPAEAAAPPEATTSPRSCLRLELAPLTLVRADEPQRRLFVATAHAGDGPLTARIRDLESCFAFTEWAGRWSLSVFTDPALARYKDDPQVDAAVKDGRWARAYLLEYSAASKQITRKPGGSP